MFSYQLNQNENVIKVVRRHPITFLLPLLKSLATFLVFGAGGYLVLSIYQGSVKEAAVVIGFLLAGMYLLLQWLVWSTTVFIITNQRIIDIDKKGLFRKTITELEYSHVQEILYEINGIIATLSKSGDVLIKTVDGTVAMEGIYRPERIYKMVIDAKKNCLK